MTGEIMSCCFEVRAIVVKATKLQTRTDKTLTERQTDMDRDKDKDRQTWTSRQTGRH